MSAAHEPMSSPATLIAVDWSRVAARRVAWTVDVPGRRVRCLAGHIELDNLLGYAAVQPGPVLIGIDAVLGLPGRLWAQLPPGLRDHHSSFAELLWSDRLPPGFFEPVSRPEDWSASRPFIRPPPGRWSRRAYELASGDALLRAVDRRLGGNSPLITAGLPGSVGAGTRALWQDLRNLPPARRPALWPFEGKLPDLLAGHRPVLAELYPKACYGLALHASLPAPLTRIAKTRPEARHAVLARLLATPWITSQAVQILAPETAATNEDDFDALLASLALLRLCLERAPLASPGPPDRIEGDILATASLQPVHPGRP